MSRLRRGARSFADFWWDFLIGDTPELFVAVLAIVAVALLLRHHHLAAIIVLPAMTVVSLVASAYRGSRAAAPDPPDRPVPPPADAVPPAEPAA
jgi:hypothetical protein